MLEAEKRLHQLKGRQKKGAVLRLDGSRLRQRPSPLPIVSSTASLGPTDKAAAPAPAPATDGVSSGLLPVPAAAQPSSYDPS